MTVRRSSYCPVGRMSPSTAPVTRRYRSAAPASQKSLSRARKVLGAGVFSAETSRVPTHELPIDEMRGDVAYQIVHDELMRRYPRT